MFRRGLSISWIDFIKIGLSRFETLHLFARSRSLSLFLCRTDGRSAERRRDRWKGVNRFFFHMCTLIREVSGSLKYYGRVFGEREITIVSTWTRWVHKSGSLAGKVPIGLTYIRSEMTVDWAALSLGTLISSRMLKVFTSILLTIPTSFITLIYTYIHTYIHIYIYIHTHTHTHIDGLVRATTCIPLFFSLASISVSSDVTRRTNYTRN